MVLLRLLFGTETAGPSWDTVLLVIGSVAVGIIGAWVALRKDKEVSSVSERMAILTQWQALDAAKSREISDLRKMVDDLEMRVDEAEAEAAACQRREANLRVEMSQLHGELDTVKRTIARFHGEGE